MIQNITIDKFEGPLDLLLHLIKQNDLDIFDINISNIAQQYFDYIKEMEKLNLDVGSEYLVMAAELTFIKSKELLPVQEEDEEDTKEQLIDRLIEYQKYKDATVLLKELEEERSKYFSKQVSLLNEFKNDEVIINSEITIEDLLNAFISINKRKELEKPLNTVVTRKEYSVHKRGIQIVNILRQKKQMMFEQLFEVYNKEYIVVTFLAILDLAKKGEIVIKQENRNEKIMLFSKEVEV